MPASDPSEQTAAAIRHLLGRIDTCMKLLTPLAGAMESTGPASLVVRYGKSISRAVNTLEGFTRDANNSFADALAGKPRTMPKSAPKRAPGKAKKAPKKRGAKPN